MKQFPQDSGSGLADQSNADFADAAHLAALGYSGIEGIISGLEFTPDFTVPDVTVASGSVLITDSGLTEIDHDDNGTTTAWPEGVQAYQVDQTTVALTDGGVNEVFVTGDQSNPDNVAVTATSDGSTPTGPALKIGEVDTSNDTTSDGWHRIAGDGTLTFPDESAATDASATLAEGTIVYERNTDTHFFVS